MFLCFYKVFTTILIFRVFYMGKYFLDPVPFRHLELLVDLIEFSLFKHIRDAER